MAKCQFEYNQWAISCMMSLDRVSCMGFHAAKCICHHFRVFGKLLTIAMMGKRLKESSGCSMISIA